MHRSLPEPLRDIAAQFEMMLDPRSSKDAVLLAPGTPEPAFVPVGLHRIERPEGVLITTNGAKAKLFDRADVLTDRIMATLLDYPETKGDVRRAGGVPVVVQGIAPGGGIAYEAAASRLRVQATVRAAQAAVPGGIVRLTTLEDALSTRAEEYVNGA